MVKVAAKSSRSDQDPVSLQVRSDARRPTEPPKDSCAKRRYGIFEPPKAHRECSRSSERRGSAEATSKGALRTVVRSKIDRCMNQAELSKREGGHISQPRASGLI